ncbi:Sulfatase-modifying factor enzyme 1 [Fibrobacter sp. UWT2]|uniref:SUMF1/EgtB/PvdO family nonheme iron enzyme n=1 Tax=Fibrobacter sp. UWT2 TaxID=1896224 RepID=UPI0009155FA8|nr:SUMF1/EgtB/PvdO family nonheme iron enzyme [Fibrobacter sp. UWT2]SHL73573.1 Sulfatase-modifying factor enzyme 1 [Fibrobacter sp. UWT2]
MKLYKLCVIAIIFAETLVFAKESLYEVDGAKVGNKTNGPKALIHVFSEKTPSRSISDRSKSDIYAEQDTFFISPKASELWLEMEKNSNYTICLENEENGIWKGNDFPYEKDCSCIKLNSGNYVKNGKIQHITQMGNVQTFNLLVGMKYIDLSTQEHLLGFNSSKDTYLTGKHLSISYMDSARYEKLYEVLLVDKYKITECEFVHALWDSIPPYTQENNYENINFWIEKKKNMTKNGLCDTHDSAATRIYLYQALIYANIRSLRDGFKPVYSFEKSKNFSTTFKEYNDGSFNINGASFFRNRSDEENFIHVKIDKKANGYRLPYYNEWVALARGGEGHKNYFNIWGGINDSIKASQYAWFGQTDSEDPYLKMSEKDPFERSWLKMSCGEWKQKSRPVGMLKPNAYGLYDMFGLVCENVLMSEKSLFSVETYSCKGGFLTTSLKDLNFGNHCDNSRGYFYTTFQGLRLVRQIK